MLKSQETARAFSSENKKTGVCWWCNKQVSQSNFLKELSQLSRFGVHSLVLGGKGVRKAYS